MAGFGRKIASYVGLVDDRRYDEDLSDEELTTEVYSDDGYEPSTVTPLPDRRPRSSAAQGRSHEPQGKDKDDAGGRQPRALAPREPVAEEPEPSIADVNRILTVHPRNFNEARVIGEHIRDGVPVIMNLTEMEERDAKRLVDFAAGLIFGVRGSIDKVTSRVFLLCPHNVNVTPEDKARIAGEGFFNQS
ncbi:cell division protein SepF [Acidipropionibacterium virtanenii]|uniref:Cell division protein SepF n=1 Tax=Acidipropionibacterium virtanenii TaxID=2057246 RepID=A0A344UV90_9ACTN|nr:cell division protein SepF [Acidipropionibacterium virtanenii]AXE39188.1 Cell division protein SepF [Acidipropionibacterium virtanenii]